MIRIPRFHDIFSSVSPARERNAPSQEPGEEDLTRLTDSAADVAISSLTIGTYVSPEMENWIKIRFDNLLRFWVATISYVLCIGLWFGGVAPSLMSVSVVYVSYGFLGLVTTWLGLMAKKPAATDYFLCTYDLLGITAAVHLTGGPSSSLYFVYFAPLVVEAIHRNWNILIYQGFGSVILYTAVSAWDVKTWTPEKATEMGGRTLFMLLGLGLTAFSIHMMKRRDDADQTRLSRMRLLNYIQQVLNQISLPSDLKKCTTDIVERLNDELGQHLNGWCRIFLIDENGGVMRAIEPPADRKPELKQELPAFSCPAIKSSAPFLLEDTEKEPGCPIENFSFSGHLCIPVVGTENESFGVIFYGSRKARAFRKDDLQFLRLVGKSIGLTIQRLQRMEELRKAWELDTCAMASFMKSAKSVEETVQTLVDGMSTLLNSDHTTVMLWAPEKAVLRTVAVRSPFNFPEQHISFGLGEGIPGKVLESGKAHLTNDGRDDLRYKSKSSSVRSLICLPLRSLRGEPLGVMTALRLDENKPFAAREFDIASTFATRAALALENASLHEAKRLELKEALDGMRAIRAA